MENTPHKKEWSAEDKALIKAVIDNLPADEKIVLQGHILGMPRQIIAAEACIRQSAVATTRLRAFKKLLALLPADVLNRTLLDQSNPKDPGGNETVIV